MKVITVGGTKGGIGKSTIAINVAVEATAAGLRVALIDTDFPQYSTMSWRSLRDKDDIFTTAVNTGTLHTDLPKMASSFDLIIIDSGGRDSNVFRSAIAASDLLLIPVLPSQFDIYAAGDTVKILDDVRPFKHIEGAFVLNQLIPNTIVSSDASEAINTFANTVKLLDTRLYARVAYKQSVGSGQGVTEYERFPTKAVMEVRALFAEIAALMKLEIKTEKEGGLNDGDASREARFAAC